MKTAITLTITKDCYILCDVFRFAIEDLLQYYMKNVSLQQFLEAKKGDYVHPATILFVQCAV